MSHHPLPLTWSRKCEIVELIFLDTEVVTNVTSQMIKKETQLDPVLSQVYNYVISGWLHVVDPSLVPFKTRQDESITVAYYGVLVLLFLHRSKRKCCKNCMTLTPGCLK